MIQLTPPGRGAIATLRVEGPAAARVVEQDFQPTGKVALHAAEQRLLHGRFGAGPGEDVVVRRESDAAVLIHCHGGSAAVARIVARLEQRGCVAMAWRAWLATRECDPFTLAAALALAEARTQRTAAILADQWGGALRRAIDTIRAHLVAGTVDAARQELERLLARTALGRHLVQPWRVAVAGAPNVGKSSLINALAGYNRAIVHPTPGTTRDLVTVQTAIDGWPVQLIDTAGLRVTDDPLEQAGIALARNEMATADLVLLVFDRERPWTTEDDRLLAAHAQALVLHNKGDRPAGGDMALRASGLVLSALSGQGIGDVLTAVSRRLVPAPPPPGAAVPFVELQISALEAVHQALLAGDLANAMAALPPLDDQDGRAT